MVSKWSLDGEVVERATYSGIGRDKEGPPDTGKRTSGTSGSEPPSDGPTHWEPCALWGLGPSLTPAESRRNLPSAHGKRGEYATKTARLGVLYSSTATLGTR